MQYEKGYIFSSYLTLYSDSFITNSLTLAQAAVYKKKIESFPVNKI